MRLSRKQKRKITNIARMFLGRPYGEEFDCIEFIRAVYRSADVHIPKISPLAAPPYEFNIRKEELKNAPEGNIIFLKDRYDPRKERKWTHAVIALRHGQCIHNSIFYGSKVTISDIETIMKDRYDFAESIPPP